MRLLTQSNAQLVWGCSCVYTTSQLPGLNPGVSSLPLNRRLCPKHAGKPRVSTAISNLLPAGNWLGVGVLPPFLTHEG